MKFSNKNSNIISTTVKTILGVLVLSLMLTTVSCKDTKKENITSTTKTAQATEKKGKEYTSAYICRMHCEGSGSDKEGKCPTCGMNYIKNKDYKKDEENHEGRNH